MKTQRRSPTSRKRRSSRSLAIWWKRITNSVKLLNTYDKHAFRPHSRRGGNTLKPNTLLCGTTGCGKTHFLHKHLRTLADPDHPIILISYPESSTSGDFIPIHPTPVPLDTYRFPTYASDHPHRKGERLFRSTIARLFVLFGLTTQSLPEEQEVLLRAARELVHRKDLDHFKIHHVMEVLRTSKEGRNLVLRRLVSDSMEVCTYSLPKDPGYYQLSPPSNTFTRESIILLIEELLDCLMEDPTQSVTLVIDDLVNQLEIPELETITRFVSEEFPNVRLVLTSFSPNYIWWNDELKHLIDQFDCVYAFKQQSLAATQKELEERFPPSWALEIPELVRTLKFKRGEYLRIHGEERTFFLQANP